MCDPCCEERGPINVNGMTWAEGRGYSDGMGRADLSKEGS